MLIIIRVIHQNAWLGLETPNLQSLGVSQNIIFYTFFGISNTLHPTIKPLQCPDTPFLLVSEASPVCLCVRNNP